MDGKGKERAISDREHRNGAADERAAARARLEARQARMHEEEGRPSRAPSSRVGAPKGSARKAGAPSPAAQRASSAGSPLPSAVAGVLSAARNAASRLFGILGPRGTLVAAGVVALVLVAAVVLAARGCAADAPEPVDNVPASGEQNEGPEPETVSVPDYLDAELAASLVQAAANDADVAWIANHADEYAVDGDAVQYKLLKLAADEPEAVPFVRAFPERYPSEAGEGSGGEKTQGGAPLLYQWDQRWGYTVYSSTTFALTGCCPTSLSMVYQGLTGKNDLSPYDMGVRAREGGYETQFDGTDATFLVNEASALGLSCAQIDVSADALAAALSDGGLVICNVGPGDFTSAGHFFVVTGFADDGTLVVNDPYSAERSAKSWDVQQVLGQTQALYAYRRA